jgi:hypothetical protein
VKRAFKTVSMVWALRYDEYGDNKPFETPKSEANAEKSNRADKSDLF